MIREIVHETILGIVSPSKAPPPVYLKGKQREVKAQVKMKRTWPDND